MAGKAKKSSKAKKVTKSAVHRRSKPKKTVEIIETKHYEISEVGPIYLEWGKKRTKNAKGKLVKEHYIKKDSKHRVWVKWVNPFEDSLETDNDLSGECKWSAEPQSVFEGKYMKQLVKEALEKKVVWPWITTKDEDSDQRKTMLKSSGFKEWKKSKAGKKNDWNMRFGIDPKTDTSGQSGSDSDGTSSTTDKEGEDDGDEDDEV